MIPTQLWPLLPGSGIVFWHFIRQARSKGTSILTQSDVWALRDRGDGDNIVVSVAVEEMTGEKERWV